MEIKKILFFENFEGDIQDINDEKSNNSKTIIKYGLKNIKNERGELNIFIINIHNKDYLKIILLKNNVE